MFLPDGRPLVIDAKFPLEAVTAFRDAATDDERSRAAQRLRQDIGRHVADIAEKYLMPGETQDTALMFVPSESVYAELHDGFDDIVQKAYRARVVLVSPSLLMLAIQVIQQIQRDARMREAADQHPRRGRRLLDDLGRLHERVVRLEQPFRPGQRGHPADPDLGREGREARHPHPGGGVRRRRGAAAIRPSSPRRSRASCRRGSSVRQSCLSPSSATKRFASAICSTANFW